MPRPSVEPGAILVRVSYSLVSVGTEIASLLPTGDPTASPVETGAAYASRAWSYLGKAVRDPAKAARRLSAMARHRLARVHDVAPSRALPVADLRWERMSASAFAAKDGTLSFTTDASPALYQVTSVPVLVPVGHSLVVELRGDTDGPLSLGALDAERGSWIANFPISSGKADDRFSFEVGQSPEITLVFSNAGALKPVRASFSEISVRLLPTTPDGLPASEMAQIGWTLGYSVAGQVVEVGAGVNDLKPGDMVACAGAGRANHADFIVVKRNLAVPLPPGCSHKAAASATVGSIALQGVRRAAPQLGDCVCVIGLGLIGQIVVQLLHANGCTVIGFDPDADRVTRAMKHGMAAGALTPDDLLQLLRDRTNGRGADRTLITAATKSDAPINLAMTATRMKGTVVVVGDIGLKVERAQFYRKEIDLLMSTSYGPGRYDPAYEEEGRDYPAAYVRWTLNRNMALYLLLIAEKRIDVESLIDIVIPIADAPHTYKTLAQRAAEKPLGVLIEYPDRNIPQDQEFDATRINLRGHARPPRDVLNYCLVGAGGFGAGMLLPQMARRRDRFFLRGIVSRDAARGGALARAHRAEVLASDLATVLADPLFDLMVLATRHHEHADQVVACLKAGKHVFVEKPLAISWEGLDRILAEYQALADPPLLMIGFNRRFAPAVLRLQEALRNRRAPLIISYRLHGGYIPPDHWVQGPQGGGRNLGEACHMYDVFRALAGAPVRSISAQAIEPRDLPYLRSDNFSATLGYQDGSVATLVYTALGPKEGLGKERIEVFCDGEAWIIDDFRKLTRASDGEVLWSGEADKGHYEQLSRFGDAVVEGKPAPISVEEIVETTAVALHVEDLLREGGGTVSPEVASPS